MARSVTIRTIVGSAVLALLGAVVAPVNAAGAGLTGDTTGPEFSTTPEARAAALHCPSPLAGATVDPVLLVHGTTLDSASNFDWNWMPALDAAGIPWCSVELVDRGMGDVQDSAEHVVHAIRTMATEAGRPVDLVGHSQGGMVGRWALKWWPDTRLLVDDVIGLAPSNHGTLTGTALCVVSCAPAIQQQQADSAFITALNDGGETFANIDYTVVYTVLDGVVTPNLDDSGSSSLRPGDGAVTNVATQDVCPLSTADHITIGTSDAVAYAIARDALDHDGPADPGRVAASVCLEPLMPGVDSLSFATDLAAALAVVAETLATYPHVTDEPPLRCYVTDSCGSADVDEPSTDAPATSPPVDSAVARPDAPASGAATSALPATGADSAVLVAVALAVFGGAVRVARGSATRRS